MYIYIYIKNNKHTSTENKLSVRSSPSLMHIQRTHCAAAPEPLPSSQRRFLSLLRCALLTSKACSSVCRSNKTMIRSSLSHRCLYSHLSRARPIIGAEAKVTGLVAGAVCPGAASSAMHGCGLATKEVSCPGLSSGSVCG